MQVNKIILAKCEKGLKDLPDNSVDCCVTDPPYGWSFMGKKWDCEVPKVGVWKQIYRVLKPGGHILVCCGPRTQHRMAMNIELAGFEIRDVIAWHYASGYPKSQNISKAMDKAEGLEREVISEGKAVKRIIPGADQHKNGWIKDDGRTFTPTETAPAGDNAKQWDGWGTALKPASEYWTLARKRLEGETIIANVLTHGTGALNIDATRIPFVDEKDFRSATWGTGTNIIGGNYAGGNHTIDSDRKNVEANKKGRWPANVILDDEMGKIMDEQSGQLSSGNPVGTDSSDTKSRNVYGKFAGGRPLTGYGDTGGASRFFYCAKPSADERKAYNTHITVKPLALMQYLIKLVCPLEPGRIVLEPFAGSGSTCIAARQLGVDFIAFEKDEQSHQIAERRLRDELGLFI